jgi:carbonic anhydrase/acetyltransferase-like protein (isoleucine patch superfamily)
MAEIYSYRGIWPRIHENTYLAPGVILAGDIELAEGVSIWHNATLRADVNAIRIGRYTNIQDNAILHEDSGRGTGLEDGLPTLVGDYVTVGHGAILHACTIEDYCLIGMGAILLDGVVIGRGSVLGAGALVTKNTVIPPFSVVLGSPARIIRTLSEDTIPERIDQAMHYHHLSQEHRRESGCGPQKTEDSK